MYTLFYYLSLVFTKVIPIFIILNRHLYEDEGGFNVELVGLLLLIVIVYYSFLKPMGEKVKVWEIQNENMFFVHNFRRIRTIIVIGGLWFVWNTLVNIEDNVSTTFTFVFISLILGLVLLNVALIFKNEE